MKKDNLKFYTVAQVSKKLQIHWQTTLSYIRSKRLKALKIGKGYRIAKKDLLDFIKNNSTKG